MVTQKSQDGVIVTTDKHGERLEMGDSIRFSYMEESGAHVLIDIVDQEVSLRRRDVGLTQALFHPEKKSEMHVHNEHGVLTFNLDIKLLNIDKDSVSIHYDLLHDNQVVGQHEFQLDWKERA